MRPAIVVLLVAAACAVPATQVHARPSVRDRPGISARADFNGDGFADLALGVPFENVAGADNAGAVNVLYGATSGLQADGAGGPDDQFWYQGGNGVEDQAERGDFFGWSVVAGDFNGDGYSDLAVGVPMESVKLQAGGQQVAQAGAVNVLYGSSSGLQTAAPADELWSQESPGIRGLAEHRDWFGWSLASGDFDLDGYDDLAVGVKGEDAGPETIPRAGAVNTIYGSADGLQPEGDQHIDQDYPGLEDQAEKEDNFGTSLASGDFNGDGFADLAIGVPLEDFGSTTNGGALEVMFGAAVGLQADGVGGPDDEFWDQDSPGVDDQAEDGDQFGLSVAAGDFNDDGFADLLAGVPREDVGDVADPGAAQALYGSPAGLQATAPNDQVWSQGSNGLQDSAEDTDLFGTDLRSGDFNGDGFADLAVGALQEDIGTVADAGAVQVIYGGPSGLQGDGVGGPDDQFWNQDSAGVQDAAEASDQFGHDVFAADFNGDGFADLATGIPFEDGSRADAGGAGVLYGTASGLQASAPDDQLWSQGSPGVQDGAEAGDRFGWSAG